MNEAPKFAAPRSVTTGPIAGSRKVYAAPTGRADISVPFREIALSDPGEAPVRVYDPSGPYTESNAAIDLAEGLPSSPRTTAMSRRTISRRSAPRRALCARAAPASSSPSSNSPAPGSSPKR